MMDEGMREVLGNSQPGTGPLTHPIQFINRQPNLTKHELAPFRNQDLLGVAGTPPPSQTLGQKEPCSASPGSYRAKKKVLDPFSPDIPGSSPPLLSGKLFQDSKSNVTLPVP